MFFSKEKFVGMSYDSMPALLAVAHPGIRAINNNFFIKQNLKMSGELITDGSVIIEGEFEGLIKANKIKLAKTGKFKGKCEVQTAVINGVINYGEIQIETGALCQGLLNQFAKVGS